MLTCENCKAAFKPSGALAEVDSLRVLCPACMRERRLARARQSSGAEPVPARSVAPGARPQAAPPGRPAPQPPPAAKAQPASQPPAAKAEAAPKPLPSAKVNSASPRLAAKAARPEPAPKAAAKPRASRSSAVAEDRAGELEKKKKREVLFAFVGAILVLVVAGLVLWKVAGQKQAEAKQLQDYADKVEGFHQEFVAIDITTVDGAKRAIALADEQKSLWSDATFAGDVVTRTAKAKTFLEIEQERATLTERVNAIEADLAKGESLTPSDLADLRRRLDDLSAKVPVLGADFVARLAHDREQAENLHVERMLATAHAAAASEPLDRAALTLIQEAEDGILKIYEASYRAWQKDKDPAITAKKEQYETAYKEVIELSDAAVGAFFTPAVVETIPWRDLLSAEEASHWKGAAVKGFEYRVENGVMHLIGPIPEEKSEGIISIGDKEVWRDFVVEAEFTVVKGRFTVFYRLPLVWQENVESLELSTDEGDGQLTAGVPYEYRLSLIGSTLVEERLGEDSLITPTSISWTKIRKGAFALSVPKETEVKFTRLRIKVLR